LCSLDRLTGARWYGQFARRFVRQLERQVTCRARWVFRPVPDGSPALLSRVFDVCPVVRSATRSFCNDETCNRTNVGLPCTRTRTPAAVAIPSLPPLGLGMLTPAVVAMPCLPPLGLGMLTPIAPAMPSLPPLGFGFLARTSRPPVKILFSLSVGSTGNVVFSSGYVGRRPYSGAWVAADVPLRVRGPPAVCGCVGPRC
jgi:hypothetical protein